MGDPISTASAGAIVVATATALSAPLVRFIDAVENGVGAAARPWMIRRVARAMAEAKLIEAKGNAAVAAIGAEEADIPVHVDWDQLATVEERAGVRASQLEARRQANIEDLLDDAADQVKDAPQESIPKETVDPDWSARFFNDAKDVSNAEMRRLWAQVFAGQVLSPGKFSFASLEILRRMSQADAALLARFAPYIDPFQRIILHPTEMHRCAGTDYADFLTLAELQLVHHQFTSWTLTRKEPPASSVPVGAALDTSIVVAGDRGIVVGGVGTYYEASVISVTRAGAELASLTRGTPPLAYLRRCVEGLRRRKLEAHAYRITGFGDTDVEVDLSNEIALDADEGGES